MIRRPQKKLPRADRKRRTSAATAEPPSVGVVVGSPIAPEVVQRAKRLEAILAKWLKSNRTNTERFAKDPARVIRELDPTIGRDLKIDPTAVAGVLAAHAKREPRRINEARDLFEVWWSWVNASSQNFSAYQTNPVATVVTAGGGFPPDQVNRLMASVAYVTGAPVPLDRAPGALVHIAAKAQAELARHSRGRRRTGSKP